MDKRIPPFEPLGRLYDPLLQLAERVHCALLIREKTVWIDDHGYVFATPNDLLRTVAPHATIGLYAKWTPLSMIEMGLRRALRERASAWIVDWGTTFAPGRRNAGNDILRFKGPRKRRRKATGTESKTFPRQAEQPNRPSPQV